MKRPLRAAFIAANKSKRDLGFELVRARQQSTQNRFTFVPLGGLLVSVGEAENRGFTARWTGNLHADREAGARKAARNGDRWQASEVPRSRVMQHGEFLSADGLLIGLQIGNGKGRHARSRSDQEIHAIERVRNGAPNLIEP
jgi:hypothetical protein